MPEENKKVQESKDTQVEPYKRSKLTGRLELRKLWSIPDAQYIYVLYQEVLTETAELVDGKANWDNIVDKEADWRVIGQQHFGNEEWAGRTAEHFGIEVPEEEYKEVESK